MKDPVGGGCLERGRVEDRFVSARHAGRSSRAWPRTRPRARSVVEDPDDLLASGGRRLARRSLSIPELTAYVRRSTEIVVEGSTLAGERREVDANGFEARCLQHEIDHVNGSLFLDRVDLLSNVFRRKRSS